MRRYFVPVAGFLLSILVPSLVNALASGSQPEPVETFHFRVKAKVFNDSGLCREHVHIEGTVQAVTDVRRKKEVVELMVSILADMRGVGALTGARYLMTGAARMDVATQALPSSIPIEAALAWIPLDQCRLPRTMTKTLRVPMRLEFDAAGALTAIGIPNDVFILGSPIED